MYSPDIIGSYNFFKTTGDGWQFAKVVGLTENAESVKFPYTIKILDWGTGNVVLASKSSRKLQALYMFAVVTGIWKVMERGIVKLDQ